MWVDIANLMGPKGADGAAGQRGEPGPINIGLDPDSPLSWDQSGGFTFNFVDGSEQTVNLPIASAQSAGLLGAGGRLPSTATRDITGSLRPGVTGSLRISRDGPLVTLTLDQITSTSSGRLASLPVGFRPRAIHRWPVENGQLISLSVNGDLYPAASVDTQNTFTMTYPTSDAWPSVLPGT